MRIFSQVTTLATLGISHAIPHGVLQSSTSNPHLVGDRRRTTSKHGECRLPSDEESTSSSSGGTEEEEGIFSTAVKNDKALKICDVLSGLDVTRLHSMDTRSLFSSAIEDVELMREYLTEATMNRAREDADVLGDLASSLDYEARNEALGTNFTSVDTTVTAGLAWVDDREDRRVGRFVSDSPNMPHNGDKASDAAMMDAASDILPWLVDRRSRESKWNVCHRNGRSEGTEKVPLPFNNLYAAGYVLSWADSLWYYPPLQVYGHPFNMADLQGKGFDSHGMVSGAYFTEENGGKPRDSFFFGPYADAMDPTGRAMVTAVSFVYYKGPFRGHEYNDDYISHLGFDILLTSVSEWLSGLEETLTPGSFAFLVDSNTFKAITISQSVVEKIYPERTGMEEHREVDVQGKPIGIDRKNQTYQVGDTIHEPVVKLENADWDALQKSVLSMPRGERGYEVLDITLTGTQEAVSHYVMFDRWEYVSDWTLLVAVPKSEVDDAIKVEVVNAPDAMMNYQRGSTKNPSSSGSFVIENNGALDVIIQPESRAPWIEFVGDTKSALEGDSGYPLPAGTSFTVDYIMNFDMLDTGTTASSIMVHILDDNYPDCFHDTDLIVNHAVRITDERNDNHIGTMAVFGWILAGVVMATSVSAAGWTHVNRKGGVVKASQPLFLLLICTGTFVMGSAMIPIGFDDGNASESGADAACMAVPWLVSLGFTISFAALLSKIWRLNQVMSAAHRCIRVVIKEKDVMKPFGVLFGLNFVLLLAWQLVDPLRFVRLSVEDNSIATADDTETYGACRSNNKGLQAFGIPILAVNICALVMACFQAYKARNISMEFSESKYLAIAVGSWFEVVLVGIPLLALVNSNPTASYFLKASMIFIVSMTLLLLIYIPKIHFHRQKQREKKEKQEKKQANARPSGVTAASDTASCMTEAGVRIVSMAPGAADNDEEDSSAARAREECEGLREELLAYRERLRQLENETSRKELDSDNRVSFSDNKVETALTIDDA